VTHIPHREIVALAEEYLRQHRDRLLPEARQLVERWTAEGMFGKRAQKAALAQGLGEAPR
jgi:hypothetical protein